jgi:hypothetical protein
LQGPDVTDHSRTGHLADEDFVLDYYGELDAADRERVHAHLAWCADCQHADRDLRATLRLVDVTPVPEPPASFERDMWARIEPQLVASPAPASWVARLGAWLRVDRAMWPRLAWAGGVAAAVVVAFFVGRAGRPDTAATPGAGRTATSLAARERVLDAEVEEHFERSQRVLTEVANLDAVGPVVLASDRERAADLVAAGRVYRRTADALGEVATSELLEDLERVLLDVANGPVQPTPQEIDGLRERIDQQDLVFRLRVVGAELRHRQGPATPTY